jgi:hypothetical protein
MHWSDKPPRLVPGTYNHRRKGTGRQRPAYPGIASGMRVENLCDRSGINVETIVERHAHAFVQSCTLGKRRCSVGNHAPFSPAIQPGTAVAALSRVTARTAFGAGIGRIVELAPIAA